MKILIIAYYFPPSNGAASLRPYYWAKYWSEAGHTITVLTRCNAGSLELPELPGVEIVSLPHFDIYSLFRQKDKNITSDAIFKQCKHKPSLFKRFVFFVQRKTGILSGVRMPEPADFWYFPTKIWLKHSNKKWDFAISTCGPYVTHCVGYTTKKLKNTTHWVADYRDLWSYHYFYKGLFPFSTIERFLEKSIIKKADLLSTVDQLLAKKLHFEFQKRVLFSLNGYDEVEPEPTPMPNGIILAYTGTFYPDIQNIIPLCLALSKLQKDDPIVYEKIKILFVAPGNSAMIRKTFQYYAIESCLDIREKISHAASIYIQKNAHALLFFDYWDFKQNKLIPLMSVKLIEYCFSGNPIFFIGAPNKSYRYEFASNIRNNVYFDSPNQLVKRIIEVGNKNNSIRDNSDKNEMKYLTRKNTSLTLLKEIMNSLNL